MANELSGNLTFGFGFHNITVLVVSENGKPKPLQITQFYARKNFEVVPR